MCGESAQTPININGYIIKNDPTLKFPYFHVNNSGCKSWTQFVDKQSLEMSFSEEGNVCLNHKLEYDNISYTLLQVHFHSIAEHTIAGK